MKTLLVAALVLLLGGTASAQDFAKGLDAMKRGDHAAAYREWRPLAEQGDAASQFNLGVLYEKGLGVAQDYALARAWYTKAADQGNAQASASLGRLHENGQGIEANTVRALMWYERAVAAGSSDAVRQRNRLALRMTSDEIAEAKRLARERLAKASDEPPPPAVAAPAQPEVREAQSLLNELGFDAGPADGVIGPRTQAALQQFQLRADLPETGAVDAELLASLQSAVAARKAAVVRPAAPTIAPPAGMAAAVTDCDRLAGHPDDRTRPASVTGVRFADIDAAPAIAACEAALKAEPNNPRLQYLLARSLHKAERIDEAVRLYRRSGRLGSALAQKSLGFMYTNGAGVPQDHVEAATWHRKAAEQGDAEAQNSLGFIYAKGQGVPQDYVQAYVWYSLAARQGNDAAAQNRQILAGKLSGAQLADAENRARARARSQP